MEQPAIKVQNSTNSSVSLLLAAAKMTINYLHSKTPFLPNIILDD